MSAATGRSERRTPPVDLRGERAIIGAMLADPEAVRAVLDIMPPEACVDPAHTLIYQRLLHGPAPLETLAKHLAAFLEDVGGSAYLEQLRKPVGRDELERHARSVLDAWRRRTLIDLSFSAGKLPAALASGMWHERPVLDTIRAVLADVLAFATRLAVLERDGAKQPGSNPAAAVMWPPELHDLAALHERYSREEHQAGDREQADLHEARAHELRRLATQVQR